MAWSHMMPGFQRKQTPCGMKSDENRCLTNSIMATLVNVAATRPAVWSRPSVSAHWCVRVRQLSAARGEDRRLGALVALSLRPLRPGTEAMLEKLGRTL